MIYKIYAFNLSSSRQLLWFSGTKVREGEVEGEEVGAIGYTSSWAFIAKLDIIRSSGCRSYRRIGVHQVKPGSRLRKAGNDWRCWSAVNARGKRCHRSAKSKLCSQSDLVLNIHYSVFWVLSHHSLVYINWSMNWSSGDRIQQQTPNTAATTTSTIIAGTSTI